MATLPPEVYTSERACAKFLTGVTERLQKLTALEKELKEQLELAKEVMLTRLEQTGQKHYAFEDLGTFKKSTSDKVAFPTAENGGKQKAVEWLQLCFQKGVISFDQLLDVQQARISSEPVLAIEEMVAEYNEQQRLKGGETIPNSPFHHFRQTTLSIPRPKRAN